MSCVAKKRLENHLDVHVNITLWKLPCSIGKFCEIYRITIVLRKMTGGKNLSWCWMSFNIAKKRKYSIIKLLASVRQKKENLIVILFKLLFATYIDKDMLFRSTSLIDLKVGSTNIEVSQRFQPFFPMYMYMFMWYNF